LKCTRVGNKEPFGKWQRRNGKRRVQQKIAVHSCRKALRGIVALAAWIGAGSATSEIQRPFALPERIRVGESSGTCSGCAQCRVWSALHVQRVGLSTTGIALATGDQSHAQIYTTIISLEVVGILGNDLIQVLRQSRLGKFISKHNTGLGNVDLCFFCVGFFLC